MSYDTLKEMFNEMKKIEQSMDKTYEDISGWVKDPRLKKSLAVISRQEKEHADNVQKILDILEKARENI